MGTYEFTWSVISFNDAAKHPRDYTVFEYVVNFSESAAELGITWGLSGPEAIGPDGMSGDGYILSLIFSSVDYKFDFAFTIDEQDTLILNTGPLGHRLSLETDMPNRLQWVAFTRVQ